MNDVNSTRGQKSEYLVHFSYIKSHKKLMLVDIQCSCYNLYDPENASTDLMVDQEILFCVGNLSATAMRNCFQTLKWCFTTRTKNLRFLPPPPPPPPSTIFPGKIFSVIFEINIVQMNGAEKNPT
jgi:hypothetical protein